jgi:GNAT superfamily N-acetyltransferase
MDLAIRNACPGDAATVLGFIRELAAYEREPDAVEASEETLRAQLASDRPPFECLIAERGGKPLGFALFFPSYSTWRGRPGLYLEDLFVRPAARGQGVGRALLARVARLALERGCARLEWAVLDWNRPAIDFYRRLGAVAMDEWTVFRLSGDALTELGQAD